MNQKFSTYASYFTPKQLYIVLGIIFLGLCLRWFHLDARPFHHDEALHALTGHYIYSDPVHKLYIYNPLLHGPLLYDLLPLVYHYLGDSNWSARFLTTFLGSLFLFIPFFFRNFFHPRTFICLLSLISLSPSLIYWTRFIQHDPLVICGMLMALYGVLQAPQRWKASYVLWGFTIQSCAKENIYVTLAILLGFLIFDYLTSTFLLKSKEHMLGAIIKSLRQNYILTALSACGCVFLYCYLYSAAFTYPEGILEGLYQKSISYWINQHEIERIKGPFAYHFFTLSFYESIFMLVLICTIIDFYREAPSLYNWCGISLIIASVSSAYMIIHFDWLNSPLMHFLKIKLPFDFSLCLFLFFHAIIISFYHQMQQEKSLCFWGQFFFASFFTYSFLGEKVPWLTTYIFLPGIVYLCLYWQKRFLSLSREHPIWTNLEQFPFTRFFVYLSIILGALSLIISWQDGFTDAQNFIFISICCALISLSLFLYQRQSHSPPLTFSLPRNLFILFLLYNLQGSFLTNFSRAGHKTELLAQVHTTVDFHKTLMYVRTHLDPPLNARPTKIFVTGNSIWPAVWYLRDMPGLKTRPTLASLQTSDYNDFVIENGTTIDYYRDSSPHAHYHNTWVPLRHWWVPQYEEMTVLDFIRYALWHEPWNATGQMHVAFLQKKNKN